MYRRKEVSRVHELVLGGSTFEMTVIPRKDLAASGEGTGVMIQCTKPVNGYWG